MALQIQLESGAVHDVALTRRAGRHPSLVVLDGRAFAASLQGAGGAVEISVEGRTETVWIAVDHDAVFIHAFGQAWRLEVADAAERAAQAADEADAYMAPMPGTLVTAAVSIGQPVSAGEPLLVIESMKMQSEIVAWRDGVVARTPFTVGDTFDRGAVLVELEPAAAEGDGAP